MNEIMKASAGRVWAMLSDAALLESRYMWDPTYVRDPVEVTIVAAPAPVLRREFLCNTGSVPCLHFLTRPILVGYSCAHTVPGTRPRYGIMHWLDLIPHRFPPNTLAPLKPKSYVLRYTGGLLVIQETAL